MRRRSVGGVPLVVRPARSEDAAGLARVAAATFPLACPPHTTDAAKVDFIATYLSESSFDGYLIDQARALFLAELDGEAVGYAMLVFREPADEDVAAAVTVRPTVELSKLYVVPGLHGAGVASALLEATLDEARHRGAAGMWLGTNRENARANRFYEKSGFVLRGDRRFLVGGVWEDDVVRELIL